MDDIIQPQFAPMMPIIVKNLHNGNNLAKANNDPLKFFHKYGIALLKGSDYEINLNTDDVFYFVIPMQSNDNLSSDQLQYAIGGTQTKACAGSSSTLSSAGTALSFSCNLVLDASISTFSSAACLFSASTASSVEPKP